MSLIIKNISKSFGKLNLFQDFNIEFQENTISCILGPSGCGKTTLLNMLSGTIKPDSGIIDGFNKKEISYIFQEPRLLPWKTVKENISFILNDKNTARNEHIDKYLQLVGLSEFTDYYPSKLSGGMKQRVAIARAFAFPSDIILMDEALKALDLKLKLNLIESFKKIWENDKRTVIFVTHDIDEALLLGNDIYVFSNSPVNIKEKITLSNNNRNLNNKDLLIVKSKIWNILN